VRARVRQRRTRGAIAARRTPLNDPGGTSPARPRCASQGLPRCDPANKQPQRAGSQSGRRPQRQHRPRRLPRSDYAQLSVRSKQTDCRRATRALHLEHHGHPADRRSAVFVLAADSRGQLAVAAFLAVMLTQAGLPGHDAAHRQTPGSRRASYIPGNLPGNPPIGLNCGWRAGQHGRHHAHSQYRRSGPGRLIGRPALTLASRLISELRACRPAPAWVRNARPEACPDTRSPRRRTGIPHHTPPRTEGPAPWTPSRPMSGHGRGGGLRVRARGGNGRSLRGRESARCIAAHPGRWGWLTASDRPPASPRSTRRPTAGRRGPAGGPPAEAAGGGPGRQLSAAQRTGTAGCWRPCGRSGQGGSRQVQQLQASADGRHFCVAAFAWRGRRRSIQRQAPVMLGTRACGGGHGRLIWDRSGRLAARGRSGPGVLAGRFVGGRSTADGGYGVRGFKGWRSGRAGG
jgi:hypothetical protein